MKTVQELCREAGMDFTYLSFTRGEGDATNEELAQVIVNSWKQIEADNARPMEERLYDEYLSLYKAMNRVLALSHVNLKIDDFTSPMARRISEICGIADMSLITCNLIKSDDKKRSREHGDYLEDIL